MLLVTFLCWNKQIVEVEDDYNSELDQTPFSLSSHPVLNEINVTAYHFCVGITGDVVAT